MKSLEKLSKIADIFEIKLSKYAQAPRIEQADLGAGETQTIVKTVGPQIQKIIAPIQDKVLYIQFSGTVEAPNFISKSVNIDSVEVFAGYPEPVEATAANQKIMNFKSTIESALLRFYRTSAGVAVLKASGSPPTFKVNIKWKLK